MFSGLNAAIYGINTLISGHKIEENFKNRGIPLHRGFLSSYYCIAKPEIYQTKIFLRKVFSNDPQILQDNQITDADLAKNSSRAISLPLEITSLTYLEILRHANVENHKQKHEIIDENIKKEIKNEFTFTSNGIHISIIIEISQFTNKVFLPIIIGDTCGRLTLRAVKDCIISIDDILQAYATYVNNNECYKYRPTSDSGTGGLNPDLKTLIKASILEEIVFRGICSKITYKIFYKVFKKAGADNIASKAAIASKTFTSLAFGLVHLHNPKPSLYQVIPATIMGFVFEILNYNYGLLAAISAHIAINTNDYIYPDQY